MVTQVRYGCASAHAQNLTLLVCASARISSSHLRRLPPSDGPATGLWRHLPTLRLQHPISFYRYADSMIWFMGMLQGAGDGASAQRVRSRGESKHACNAQYELNEKPDEADDNEPQPGADSHLRELWDRSPEGFL